MKLEQKFILFFLNIIKYIINTLNINIVWSTLNILYSFFFYILYRFL